MSKLGNMGAALEAAAAAGVVRVQAQKELSVEEMVKGLTPDPNAPKIENEKPGSQTLAAKAFSRIPGVQLSEATLNDPIGTRPVVIIKPPAKIANALRNMDSDALYAATGGDDSPASQRDLTRGWLFVEMTEANKPNWDIAAAALAKAVPGTKLLPAAGRPAAKPGPTR